MAAQDLGGQLDQDVIRVASLVSLTEPDGMEVFIRQMKDADYQA